MSRSARNAAPTDAQGPTALRWLTGAGVIVSAVVHLYLYVDGFDSIDVIGPLFLLNGIAGLVIGVAVLVSRHPIWLLLAVGFCASTLGAFLISATVGLFGVREPFWGMTQTTAFVAELVGLVCGALLLLRWWRHRS